MFHFMCILDFRPRESARRAVALLWMVVAWGTVSPDGLAGDRAREESPRPRRFLVRGATLHPVAEPAIPHGYLLVRDGRIEFLGQEPPKNAKKIPTLDARGKHLYPSLIDADTAIGLVEIEAVRATVDFAEVGPLNPNAKAVTAFNPDSELIPVARADGVLLAHSVPRGSFVAGISALMQLDGWTVQDMALVPQVGLHVRWPPATYIPAWNVDPALRSGMKRRQELLRMFSVALEDARDALRNSDELSSHNGEGHGSTADNNLRLEALRDVVTRKIPVMVHADELRAIQEAVAFAKTHAVRLVIVGGYDAPACADLLKENDVPVIITGTQRLPLRRDSAFDEPFTVPERLRAAGVHFCIAGFDRFSASAIR
ncbi:MAG TPA: hypothetical protein VIY86_03480, partial [Pirellulaceae bacterium]